MKIRLLLPLFALALFPSLAISQMGTVYDNQTMDSEILNGERKYAIFLPPDYDSSERSYPVLYLLHGAGDDQTGWVQFGEVRRIADKAILEGTATSMIIVMPDADTGRRGYFNNITGEWRYEDFFFEEFIPHVESTYRIKAEKRYRAVSGLSMGGGGTFMYALKHPEMFSSAAPLSASTGPISREGYMENTTNVTSEQIDEYFNHHSALALVNNRPADEISSVRWYIDCGDDDFLYEGNSLVHIAMRKRDIPHEFRIRDGAHNWTYWRESLPDVLNFVSMAFTQY
ncbi:MAG: alpha/beta hydrolase-fold protein [Balneolaceae bacterium]